MQQTPQPRVQQKKRIANGHTLPERELPDLHKSQQATKDPASEVAHAIGREDSLGVSARSRGEHRRAKLTM